MRQRLKNWLFIVAVLRASSIQLAHAVETEDVAFAAKLDGSQQRYVLVIPDGTTSESPVSALIVLHGHGADRWQFVKEDREECRAARDAAAKRKMIYVAPDYRAKTSWMGPAAEADVLQIIDELRSRFKISKCVISGASMGGTAALTFAALHPDRVDGVVSMNGTANHVEYTQFQEAIAASFGGTKIEKPDEYRKRSAELHADKLTMPIAMTTGGRDTLVPPESVLRLADRLQKHNRNSKLIHRLEGGHSTTYADATAAFDFVLEKVLSGAGDATPNPLLEFGRKPMTIVCLGDSVTGVYYHTGGRRAYPEMLEVAIRQAIPGAHVKVINAGISGHSTTDGIARLDRDVLAHKPDLVTISFGLNDMTRLSEDEYRANLVTLVTRCREAHAAVVLCTPNSVITTTGRPIEKLRRFWEVICVTARALNVPVCDQFVAGEALRSRDAWAFRCTLSDEIHPNMDGHKRMAEELCRTITRKVVSLKDVPPTSPALVRTRKRIEQSQPVKILAMPPFDTMIRPALKAIQPDATLEVTTWDVKGKSLADLEQFAKQSVRAMKPDLVLIAVPVEATASSDEEYFRSYSWIMNWSLSFGIQEWDCLVVHPAVATPDASNPRSDLIRQLVKAQDLILIDRHSEDQSDAAVIFAKAISREW